MATLPKMTLAQIRTAARQRADFVNDDFVTDSELNSIINESLFELFDELVSTYGDDYYATVSSNYTTDGTNDAYALPTDFYKLLGVDLQVSNSPNGWVSLKQFPLIERNRYSVPNTVSMAGFYTNLRYRLRDNNIWFTPFPVGGQVYRLIYIPRMEPLVDASTITFVGVEAGDTVTFDFNGSGETFTADDDFAVGSTDAETATNFANAVSTLVAANPTTILLSAEASSNVVSIYPTAASAATYTLVSSSDTKLAIGNTNLDDEIAYPTTTDGYSGWLNYVIVDAARAMIQKQEQDTTPYDRELDRIRARIVRMAPARDAGSPQRVGDVYRTGNGWMGGWGDGEAGGGGWG